jgi:alpha-L-fucosidase
VERNSESIYGTTANPFGELPWGYCTVKGTKLYLFVRDWPKDNILNLPDMKNRVTSASLLIDKSVKLTVVQNDNKTSIKLPSNPPDNPISVLVLEIEGTPKVNPQMAMQDDSGKIVLNYLTADTRGNTMTRFNRKGGFHISKWKGPEDVIEWMIKVDKPGKFQMFIDYAANKEWEGKKYEITIGKSRIENKVVCTGDWYDYFKFPVSYVELPEAGEYTLTIRPKETSDTYLMYLSSITLKPVESIKQGGWGVN